MPASGRGRLNLGRRTDIAQLRALRERAGLTPGKLAERLGVTPHTIQSWEKGERPVRKVWPMRSAVPSPMCAKPKTLLAARDSCTAPSTFGGGIGGALWPLWVQEIEKRKGRQANAPMRRGVHHHTRKTTKIANNSNHARPVSWIISTPSAMSHFFHFGLDIATRAPPKRAEGVILPTPSQPGAPERVPRASQSKRPVVATTSAASAQRPS
jgi:DNA-binding XRE family transcriptional regulator